MGCATIALRVAEGNPTVPAVAGCVDVGMQIHVQREEGGLEALTQQDADLFVRASTAALEGWVSQDRTHDYILKELTACMTRIVELSIVRKWKHFGSYITLCPWTQPLHRLFHPDSMSPPGARVDEALFPHALIRSIARSRDEGLYSAKRDPWRGFDTLMLSLQSLRGSPARRSGWRVVGMVYRCLWG